MSDETMTESDTPISENNDERPPIEMMSDKTLYEAYQHAKEHGSQLRFDELQSEIAQRWETVTESMYTDEALDTDTDE